MPLLLVSLEILIFGTQSPCSGQVERVQTSHILVLWPHLQQRSQPASASRWSRELPLGDSTSSRLWNSPEDVGQRWAGTLSPPWSEICEQNKLLLVSSRKLGWVCVQQCTTGALVYVPSILFFFWQGLSLLPGLSLSSWCSLLSLQSSWHHKYVPPYLTPVYSWRWGQRQFNCSISSTQHTIDSLCILNVFFICIE